MLLVWASYLKKSIYMNFIKMKERFILKEYKKIFNKHVNDTFVNISECMF